LSGLRPVSPSSLGDLGQQLHDLLQNIGAHPAAVITRAVLTFVVVLAALFGGRWLAWLASRAPLHVERTLARSGRFRQRLVRDESSSAGPWLGRLTGASVWFAALVAIALIWLWDQTMARVKPEQLGAFFGALALRAGGSLLILACTLGIGRLFQRSLEASLARRVNPNLSLLSGRVLYIAILAIGLIIILGGVWDTGIVLPVTLIGALTVALSLALQDVLKNLVSGIYLLVERPFSIGDRISLTPYTGEVEDIEIRYTALRTEDGQRVIIPNSMLFSSAVVNLSAYEHRRAGFTVTVPDTGPETIDRAEGQIRAALESAQGVLKQPDPEVVVTRAAGGTVDLHVVYWLPTANLDASTSVFSHVLEQVRSQVKGAEISSLDAAVSASAV
jgi:small-conductance mechanosensitive channel